MRVMNAAKVRVVGNWRPDKRFGFVRVASGGTFPECRVNEVPVLIAYGDGVEPLSGGVSRAAVLKEWREAYRAADGLFVEIDDRDVSGSLEVRTHFAHDGVGVSGLVHGTDNERDAACLA